MKFWSIDTNDVFVDQNRFLWNVLGVFGAHNDICMCYEEYIKRGSKEKLKCSNYVHGLQYINNLLRLRKICRWATKLCSTNTAFFVLYWNMIILLEFIASKTIRISSVRFEDYTRTRYKPSRKTGGLDYSLYKFVIHKLS